MTEVNTEFSKNTARVLSGLCNLRPSAYRTVVDTTANLKDRWNAFDNFYAEYISEMRDLGFPLEDAEGPLAVAEGEHRIRQLVALTLMQFALQGHASRFNEALWEMETLVPTPPNPDSGLPRMNPRDQALLNMTSRIAREEFPQEFTDFFLQDTVPLERRKHCFEILYAVISKSWREDSLFARSLTPAQRQEWVIFALMCYVPRDQWTTEDLERLGKELLPVAEPEEKWLKDIP